MHTLYQPDTQVSAQSTLLVRTAESPDRLAPRVVETIRQLDPNRPIGGFVDSRAPRHRRGFDGRASKRIGDSCHMHHGLSSVISTAMFFGTLTSMFFAKMPEAGVTQAESRDGTTVWDGAYTADQAKRGEAAFMVNCSECHAEDLNGSPPLKGVQFMDNWREDTLGRLFTHMKTTMPRDGTRLSDATYLDVLAFVLQGNAFPAGPRELTLGTIETVRLIGKDGPRPLPNLATVLVVGCLTRDSSNAWILTNGTDPVRTRNARETTEEELKASGAKPLGTQVFRLQNLQNSGFNPGFSPERHQGQKVQIKGVLVRQPNNDRINVTWPDVAGSSCVQ